MTVERIYIGGLDPPRLTGTEIVSRLKSLDVIEILSIVGKENKPFVHITATSKGPDSALEIISKKYNNVKWKGCKLAVAAARPHFLQLLEIERQDRLAKQKQEQEEDRTEKEIELEQTNNDINDGTEIHQYIIPRRLRIRKKFGDEAFHVDTKPWEVDNWKKFVKATGKLRKRVESHISKKNQTTKASDVSYKVAPIMHRAVHIKFGGTTENNNNLSHSKITLDHDESSSSSSNSNDDISISSSSSSESHESSLMSGSDDHRTNGTKTKKEAYAWSDDDGDSDDDDDDNNNNSKIDERSSSVSSEESSPNNAKEEERLQHVGSITNHKSEEAINPSESDELAMQQSKSDNNKEEYQWSSESSGDESSELEARNRPAAALGFKEVTTTDEFAAGFDSESDNDSRNEEEEEEVGERRNETNQNSFDMGNDVSANLNILSDLFPEMTGASPALIAEDSKKGGESIDKANAKPKSNFGAVGLMPRYDPRDESTQKYVVDEKKDESTSNSTQSSDSDNESDNNSIEEAKDEKNDNATDDQSLVRKSEDQNMDLGHVYHQEKLEDVFREARSAWQDQTNERAQNSVPQQSQATVSSSGGGGAFSFGFDLGESEQKESTQEQANSGFSFGFDLPAEKVPETSNISKEQKESNTMPDEKNPESQGAKRLEEERRRVGLRFPSSDLKMHEADFFAFNDGERIMDDVEGFRMSNEVKEEWNKERQTLTLDWKRKRKYAMSRIQKRMKFR